ncbi:ATP-binding protein [Vibrio profundum]|uniref:ATP-binding protein n=1 Tax=Vibrio profundum TaxID=2910247 RepID=UPI003D0F9D41
MNIRTIIFLVITVSLLFHLAFLAAGSFYLQDFVWVSYEVHSSVEMAGSVIALVMALILVFFEKAKIGTSYNIPIAAGFVSMGVFDAFHAAIPTGQVFVFLHSMAVFVGGIFFLSVYVSEKWTFFKSLRWLYLSLAISVLVSTFSLLFPNLVPSMVVQGEFSLFASSLNSIGGIALFASAIKLIHQYRLKKEINDLLFCLHCVLFGSAAIMFELSGLWDISWWGWHFLRMFAYVVALWIIILDGIKVLNIYRSKKEELEKEVELRTHELNASNSELVTTLSSLKLTQKELVEAEKMASLGQMISGIAHEINTPLGVAITGVSSFDLWLDEVRSTTDLKKISESVNDMSDMKSIIQSNLDRASALVDKFKMASVANRNFEISGFYLKNYIDEIFQSRSTEFVSTKSKYQVLGDEKLFVNTYQSIVYQMINILISNTFRHGMCNDLGCDISVKVRYSTKCISIVYTDNGKGIPSDVRGKVFDPFTTSERSSGCLGLGLHILYNLVVQKLGGTVGCKYDVDQGVYFAIDLPVTYKDSCVWVGS